MQKVNQQRKQKLQQRTAPSVWGTARASTLPVVFVTVHVNTAVTAVVGQRLYVVLQRVQT